MSCVSFGSAFRAACVVLTLGAGTALAGFQDISDGPSELPPPSINDQPLAEDGGGEAPVTLDLKVGNDQPPAGPSVTTNHPPVDNRNTPPAIAAPLPVALLPGGIMIAGSFIITRVFKRRIV